MDLGSVDWDVWVAVDHAVVSLETTTPASVWSDETEQLDRFFNAREATA
jgi:hypothetical protein